MGHPGVVDPAAISSREGEVLAALDRHLSNAQIASLLHISVRTVESHVSALMRKLGAPDRHALAAVADQARIGRFARLPAGRTSFVGRSAERGALLVALDESRMVSLVGPGGVGKTRLVTLVAEDAAPRFPAGGAFVDLVPARAGTVVRAVAEALGAVEGPTRTIERSVLERLRTGRPLLVLDNCEHVIDEISELAERVLAECPHATILATSRQRLGVTGERLVHLHPLQDAADAEQLFLDRARASDPDFRAGPSVVADLCGRLDGMPLAIELAAARAASLGADGLLAGLDDRLRLLSGGRGGHGRHHSLRAVIGWSYDLLDDDERAMFRRLSVFVGGFDLDAATALSPELTRPEVADLLGRLVDRSVVVRPSAGASRWRMLDTIRAFGRTQVTALGELDAVRELHFGWAHAAAVSAEGHLDRSDGDWQSGFDGAADDLRAAAAALPPGRDVAAHRFLRSLAHLTFARGRFVEACTFYRGAAERAASTEASCLDLRDAADAAVAVADGHRAVELVLEAAGRSDRGDVRAQAVVIGVRYGVDRELLPAERRTRLLAGAAAAADPADDRLATLLATASAWHHGVGVIADLELARRPSRWRGNMVIPSSFFAHWMR